MTHPVSDPLALPTASRKKKPSSRQRGEQRRVSCTRHPSDPQPKAHTHTEPVSAVAAGWSV